jgi:hypothetical protein
MSFWGKVRRAQQFVSKAVHPCARGQIRPYSSDRRLTWETKESAVAEIGLKEAKVFVELRETAYAGRRYGMEIHHLEVACGSRGKLALGCTRRFQKPPRSQMDVRPTPSPSGVWHPGYRSGRPGPYHAPNEALSKPGSRRRVLRCTLTGGDWLLPRSRRTRLPHYPEALEGADSVVGLAQDFC